MKRTGSLFPPAIVPVLVLLLPAVAALGRQDAVRFPPPASLVLQTGHAGPVREVLFMPDGQRLVTAGRDHTLRLWEAGSGLEIRSIPTPGANVALAVSPDGNLLASTEEGGDVRLWNLRTGVSSFLTRDVYTSYSLTFNRDGTQLASAAGSEIHLWDTRARGHVEEIKNPGAAVRAVAFLPSGLLVSGGDDGRLRIWNPARAHDWDPLKPPRVLEVPAHQAAYALAASRDGRFLASGHDHDTLLLWDLGTGKVRTRGQLVTRPPVIIPGRVNSVAFSPGGKRFGGVNGVTLGLWETATGAQVPLRPAENEVYLSLAFNPDGTCLATSAGDGFSIRSAVTGASLYSVPSLLNPVHAVAFGPGGRLAAGGEDTLRLWDIGRDAPPLSLPAGFSGLRALSFSPDGNQLASADYGAVRVWDLAGKVPPRKIDAGGGT